MAKKYKGEVEFQDSEGKSYVLRLGTFEYCEIEEKLATMNGRKWQLHIFHAALVNGSEAQQKMTLRDAAEIIDDLGAKRVNELIEETRFGADAKKIVDEANAKKGEGKKAAPNPTPEPAMSTSN